MTSVAVTAPTPASSVSPSAPAPGVQSLGFSPMTVTFSDITYTVTLPKKVARKAKEQAKQTQAAGAGGDFNAQAGGASTGTVPTAGSSGALCKGEELDRDKVLLRGISGYALPGRMTALMGASGAGKTTLLDVLSSRKNSGRMGGSITLNGHPKEERTFNRIAAYVEQTDLHAPLTTVREAVSFSAALRLPPEVPAAQREAFVAQCLALLELTDIQDRLVGLPGTPGALSPQERKRLTICVELVSNSPVIFCDEPTSGLDSRAAAVVMRVLKRIADSGRTIICTVHQPSADLFSMFDDLLLLQRGGYQVYMGPVHGTTNITQADGTSAVVANSKCEALLAYLATLPSVPPRTSSM